MYRFALRPLWLLSHVAVAALVLGLFNLGLWQLRRLDERQARNAEVAARIELPAMSAAEVVDGGTDPDDVRFRRVEAVGMFVAGADLLVDNRSLAGFPGAWVVTPLELASGEMIVVNRGFAGVGPDGRVEAPAPPSGEVRVTGHLVEFAERDCRTRDGDDGVVIGVECLSSLTAEAAFGTEVAPVVVQQSGTTPPDDASLSPVPLPEADDGPHFGYAVQWFIFTTVAVVGYPLILRKNARERAVADDPATDEDDVDLALRRLIDDEGRADTPG